MDLISVIFILPMFKLLHVQVMNFILGKTTNERFGRQHQMKQNLYGKSSASSRDLTSDEDRTKLLKDQEYHSSRMENIQIQRSLENNSQIDIISHQYMHNNRMNKFKRRGTKVDRAMNWF